MLMEWKNKVTVNKSINPDLTIVIFTVIVGEIANFAAYAFAPALLVTPLGALSIIIRHGLKLHTY